jgi:drug/metabolite transporter (DMT)-like permease
MTTALALLPPDPPLHLLLPLTSSLLYVASALALKRATQKSAGVWRTTFLCNIAAAVLFAPLPLIWAAGPGPAPLWQAALIALAFVVGQVCTMVALNFGDVSVATPVVGTKVVFVAFFVTLLVGQGVSADLWASAGMNAARIALLNRGSAGDRRHVGRTIVASLLAAVCYGLFDTLVRKWAGDWGVGRLLATVMAMNAVMSLALLPLVEKPLLRPPHAAVRPMLLGALLLALQAVVLVTTLGRFDDTTRINVVYNSRGLWSVLVVWLVGHRLGNHERETHRGVFGWRIAGAALMLGAVLVAILHPIASFGSQ